MLGAQTNLQEAAASRRVVRALAEAPEGPRIHAAALGVAHGLERASKRMKSEAGVTGPQRLVLRVVALFPGLSAGELAGILHVHPSTLTGVLQRLESQGLLVRAEDSLDRRRVALRLTPAGSRVNETRRGTVELAVARTLDRVGAADRTAAKRVLGRLARRLAAAGGRAARSPRRTTERVRPRKAGLRA